MPDQITGLLSPLLRDIRLKQVKQYCSGKILDYGCGTGALAARLADTDYVGVDADPQSLEIARATFRGKMFFQYLDPAWKNTMYDTVVMAAVIEHLPDPEKILEQIGACLKENGRIVITTPDPRFEFLHAFAASFRVLSKEASGEHCSRIDRAAMENIASSAGLELTVSTRFMFGLNQCFVLQKRKRNDHDRVQK